MSFFFTKSKGLKFGFLVKGGFPREKGAVAGPMGSPGRPRTTLEFGPKNF